MAYWEIFFFIFLTVGCVMQIMIFQFDNYKPSKQKSKTDKWLLAVCWILMLVLIFVISATIKHEFDNVVKKAYYNGVSVKVEQSINSS